MEVEHSSTLIGHKACRDPAMKNAIDAIKSATGTPSFMRDVIAHKRSEIAKLNVNLKLAQTQAATMLVKLMKIENEMESLKQKI